jgi:hypothetical protein
MKALTLTIIGLLLATYAIAQQIEGLTPNPFGSGDLEIISQDSVFIVVLDRDTGRVDSLRIEPGGKRKVDWGPPVIADVDTCFSFEVVGHTRPMGYCKFGDADHDGLIEIVGIYGGRTWLFEYSGHDTTYIFQDTIYHASPVDYGKDSDGDGLLEYLAIRPPVNGAADLYEASDSISLPRNIVFSWPIAITGSIGDIDGDSTTEISLKPSPNRIEAWRATGDSEYELAYTIRLPVDIGANFADYVYGDFDEDGRYEVIVTSDIGVVVAYEVVAPDSFQEVWRGQVNHYNAFDIVGPAEMDGDGDLEFVVMSRSCAGGGFFFYFFESTGDNQFEQIDCDSLPGDCFEDGGMGLWDFDRDELDELAVCAAPYWAGVYKAAADNDIQLVHLFDEIPGVRMYVYDTNSNGRGEMVLDRGFLSGLTIMEFTPGRGYIGDINCDCNVNGLDVTYIVGYFKGQDNPLPPNIYLADINGNCQINGVDVSYFVNWLRGAGAPPIDGDCER